MKQSNRDSAFLYNDPRVSPSMRGELINDRPLAKYSSDKDLRMSLTLCEFLTSK